MRTIYTIGHSTRSPEEFSSILRAFSIRVLVDIRSIPRSRTNPQYNQDVMPRWLAQDEISYIHCGDLGGLRHARPDSINRGWRNDSFRGYADYMQTRQFENAIAWLISLPPEQAIAIMCAEAVPWRCHRSLVGDALLVRGIEVEDIMSAGSSKPHRLTPFAQVDGLRITYPATANTAPSD